MPVGRAILLGALVCACGEAAGPPGSLSVFVVGRLERGSVVVVQARSGTDLVPDTSVTWSAQPSDAVQFPAPGRALLARATPVVLTAAKAGATGSLGFDVAVPPTIVFDLLRDGNRDIYKAALDGGDLARLTTDPADDVRPTAAGATVVFVSYRDGRGALYAVPLAGGPDHRLAVAAGEESIRPCPPTADGSLTWRATAERPSSGWRTPTAAMPRAPRPDSASRAPSR